MPRNWRIEEWSPRSVKTFPPREKGEMMNRGIRTPVVYQQLSFNINCYGLPGPEKVYPTSPYGSSNHSPAVP